MPSVTTDAINRIPTLIVPENAALCPGLRHVVHYTRLSIDKKATV